MKIMKTWRIKFDSRVKEFKIVVIEGASLFHKVANLEVNSDCSVSFIVVSTEGVGKKFMEGEFGW